jgi:hypothetical protein
VINKKNNMGWTCSILEEMFIRKSEGMRPLGILPYRCEKCNGTKETLCKDVDQNQVVSDKPNYGIL